MSVARGKATFCGFPFIGWSYNVGSNLRFSSQRAAPSSFQVFRIAASGSMAHDEKRQVAPMVRTHDASSVWRLPCRVLGRAKQVLTRGILVCLPITNNRFKTSSTANPSTAAACTYLHSQYARCTVRDGLAPCVRCASFISLDVA